uniref:14-3-3 domain-containing protein n=1 Tax=Setaria digitata TaxID=48799 RepID=A0A915Q2E8_9BILA
MSLCEVAKDDMDEKQLQCWRTLFEKIQTAFNDGLATQRKRYLRKSIVGKEMGILATIWKQVRTKYMEEDGNLTKCSALMYEALQRYCRKIPKTKQYSRKLKEIADQTINAMNKVITAYDSTYGLTELVDRLDSYCYLCCTINVSPRILWMAFNEGFENIITSKLDEDIIQVKQIWWKVARVLEQVIKNFIASNLHIWKRINGIE